MENNDNAIYGRNNTRVHQEMTAAPIRLNPLASNYENMFAQLRPLIDEMKIVIPYGVGRNGARRPIGQTPELAQLMFPNEQMGWTEFADAMFATWLTESELDIHVHRTGRRRVIGYTILPVGCKFRDGEGNYYFQFMDGNQTVRLTTDDVMMLRFSRNPRNIEQGVSPTSSVEIWAQIDDLAAQYQRAFFENGAVPATITFITASTREKYNEKRRALERGLKGAENKNKTIYAWRQLLDDGNSGDEVEVKTIQPPNSTLAIKDLNAIIVDRLNKAIGVSNFILGDDSSAKYDNAELSDHQFTKRRVYPALVSFWGQFQHELDRILGGLGYAIDFDLEIPELTERERVKAETAKIKAEEARIKQNTKLETANTLITLINAGADPASTVSALGLNGKWGAVAQSMAGERTAEAETTDNTNALVLNEYTPQWGEGEENLRAIYNELLRLYRDRVSGRPADTDSAKQRIAQFIINDAKDGALDGVRALLNLDLDNPEAVAVLEDSLNSGEIEFAPEIIENLTARTDAAVDRFDEAVVAAVAAGVLMSVDLRAEQIARGESHYAYNYGRGAFDRDINRRFGLRIMMEWHAHIDSRTCMFCRLMDGQIVPIDGEFADHVIEDGEQWSVAPSIYNDYGHQPNAHVGCRCTFREVLGT